MIKEVADKFSEMLISQIHSTKKIRTVGNEVEDTVNDLMVYLQYFNSKKEFDTWFLDRHMDDIKIIQELSSLVYPAAVRLNASDLRCKDLLDRTNLKVKEETEKKLSYEEFIRLQNNFRRFFKSDISERTVTLGSLRTVKNFSEVLPHITLQPENVGGTKVLKVHYQNEAFIPIPVTNRVSAFFEKEYWNATAATVIEHFVRDMK